MFSMPNHTYYVFGGRVIKPKSTEYEIFNQCDHNSNRKEAQIDKFVTVH
jgi:hypothetical protein